MTNLITKAFVPKLNIYSKMLPLTKKINKKKQQKKPGTIKGTSKTKLGLESLKFRRKFRQLCTFFRIKTKGKPEYLFNLIPAGQYSYNTHTFFTALPSFLKYLLNSLKQHK